jgi:hypothetical protein
MAVRPEYEPLRRESLLISQGFAPFGSPASLQAGTDSLRRPGERVTPVRRALVDVRTCDVPTLENYRGYDVREITRR